MSKRPKLYSGRSGYSAYGEGGSQFNLRPNPKGPIAGEKTTVRSGAKSSKTFITTEPMNRGQSFSSGGLAKTNKKKSSKKK